MSRKAQIQAKADWSDRMDVAWAKFDKDQASREAEIRRPARKTNVMSDEEYFRLRDVRELYRRYLAVVKKGMFLREPRLKIELADFFAGSFTLDSDDQKQAASEAATCISNSLSLYCQAHDNPYRSLRKVEGYTGDSMPGLPDERSFIDLSRMSGGFLPGNVFHALEHANEAINSQKWPSQFILTEIKHASESSGNFKSSETAGLLKDLLSDSKLIAALLGIITKVCLEITETVEEACVALAQLQLLLPEGASGNLPDTISEGRVAQLESAVTQFQQQASEVNGTRPWLTPGDEFRMDDVMQSIEHLFSF